MEKQLITPSNAINTTGKTQIIGYKRVSTVDQHPDNQLADYELDKIFIDHVSGKTIERPALKEMLAYVRDGDHIIVHAMDRLARNTQDLLRLVDHLISRNVSIRFVAENLTFDGSSNPIGKLLLTMMGAVAEFEMSLMDERRREGIKRAQKEGKYRGRPKGCTPIKEDQINYIKRAAAMGVPILRISRELGVTRDTVRKYAKPVEV